MKTKMIIVTAAALVTMSSQAFAASHYDGGCAQLHFAEDGQAATLAKTDAKADLSVHVANPVLEGANAADPNQGNSDKLQQARFQHHETAGAVDCELDAIED